MIQTPAGSIGLNEASTWYMGKRERVAVVFIENVEHTLTLADTRRCAASEYHCLRTLSNLGHPARGLEAAAAILQGHCRAITKYKEGFHTKENPNGIKRDKPRRTFRRWR